MEGQGFTCITCRVVFPSPELQRAHYKTDWHRYNLKRKVAELPPVTAENFQQRVLAQQAADKELETSHSEFCPICKKLFTSQKSYESHVRSRKHKEKEAAQDRKKSTPEKCEVKEGEALNEKNLAKGELGEEAMEVTKGTQAAKDTPIDTNKLTEEEDSMESDYEPEPLENTECLFCSHGSDDLEENLKHMALSHGFFIPDLDFIVDIKGLISYLGEKVGVGFMCLHCNERRQSFYSVQSAQQHMVDKCHCKIFFEGDAALEYAEYYDYTKSYPDQDDPMEGSSRAQVIPDGGLEVTEDLELVLPSGTRVGHRSLKHVYKQHTPSDEKRKSTLVGRLLAQYRAIEWKGKAGECVVRSERDVSWMRKMKQTSEMRLGVKANKLQKHFRPQVIF